MSKLFDFVVNLELSKKIEEAKIELKDSFAIYVKQKSSAEDIFTLIERWKFEVDTFGFDISGYKIIPALHIEELLEILKWINRFDKVNFNMVGLEVIGKKHYVSLLHENNEEKRSSLIQMNGSNFANALAKVVLWGNSQI